MNRFLLPFAALVLALAAWPAAAQQYGTTTITQVVTAGGTSNVNQVIPLTKYEDVTVQARFVGTAASTNGNVTITFAKGISATEFETTGSETVVLAANGATAVVKVQNITVGACGYLKLTTIQNAATAGDGTATVIIATKPKRPGKS